MTTTTLTPQDTDYILARLGQAQGQYAAALTALSTAAGSCAPALDTLNTLVHGVARADGELWMWSVASNMADAGAARADIAAEVTSQLLAGADDTWSGRGNDTRRARYDGMRDAARALLYLTR